MGTLCEIELILLLPKIEKGRDTDEICSGGSDRQHTAKKVPAKYGEAKIEQESKKMAKTEKGVPLEKPKPTFIYF